MVFFKVVHIELCALSPTCLTLLEDVLEHFFDVVLRTPPSTERLLMSQTICPTVIWFRDHSDEASNDGIR